MRIILIGTSHISKQSVDEITQAIETYRPTAVAIELDAQRLAGLSQKNAKVGWKAIRAIGIKGYLFATIASAVQHKLAKVVGTEPGDDMRAAVRAAQRHNIPLLLIDQPIHLTLRRVSQSFGWREKLRLCADIFRGLLFPKRELKRRGLTEFDLSKVPPKSLIKKLILELKERYPSLYTVLIDERNEYMVRMLRHHAPHYPGTVVVVVGAGHEEGMIELLKASPKIENPKGVVLGTQT